MTEQSTVSREMDVVAFKEIMAELPAPVVIVTTAGEDGVPYGATVSSVTSLSVEPAMLLVCLAEDSDTLAALSVGGHFLVNVAADGQEKQVTRFAGKGQDKFAGQDWSPGLSGQPQIVGAAVVIDCVVTDMVRGGDHTIVVGTVVAAERQPWRTPIVYHRRRLAPSPAARAS